jgi:PBP1b-binding outer membrane lipoprotein LpoB
MRTRGILGVWLVPIMVLAGCSSDGKSSGAPWVACKNAVKAQVTNPATADFALLSTTIEDTVIDGKLTAKNDFGVDQELRFHCKMSGETVTSVEVLPTK